MTQEKRKRRPAGNVDTEKEPSPTKEEVEEYLAALVQKLNVRLLCEPEEKQSDIVRLYTALQPKTVLWVESITLTSYEVPEKKRAHRIRRLAAYLRKKRKSLTAYLKKKVAEFFHRKRNIRETGANKV